MEDKEKKGEVTEEKKSKENKGCGTNITTILLVLALIVIVAMGVFIVKLNKDKSEAIKKVESVEKKNSDLNQIVSELQRKIDSISETINSNGKVDILSKEEAEKILKEKFDVLEKIYLKPDEFFNVKEGEEIKNFEETIQKYGTNNLVDDIKNNLPMCIKMEDGKYIFQPGGGERAYNGFDKFEDVRATEQTIAATLKTKQRGPKDSNDTEWRDIEDKKSEFALVKSGDNWLMDNVSVTDFE